MSDEEWNFIDEYISLLNSITDAPHAFKKATALYLMSTAVGRRITLLSLPETRFFEAGLGVSGKLLNLWFVLIGKTRISRKSTVVGRAEEFIREIDSSVVLPQDFTPQSLISNLKDKTENDETRATWIHDEVSGFFELLNKGDYMVSVDAVLSRIYDGRSYYRSTITRGDENVLNPYLTILVASTDSLPSLFSETMIRQGFLNRFIYAVGTREDYRPIGQHIDASTRSRAQKILTWLRTVRNSQTAITIVMSREATELFEEYELEVERKIQSGELDIEEGYQGNLPNMLSRFAALHRLARMAGEDIDTFNSIFLIIEKRDMEWAINYANECWENFKKVIVMMKTYATSRVSNTDERVIERVFTIIRDHTPISRSHLYRRASLTSSKLEEVISTLITQDRINMVVNTSATKPSITYSAR